MNNLVDLTIRAVVAYQQWSALTGNGGLGLEAWEIMRDANQDLGFELVMGGVVDAESRIKRILKPTPKASRKPSKARKASKKKARARAGKKVS